MYNIPMRITFPEYNDETIQAAIKQAGNIEAIAANNLEDAGYKLRNCDADAVIAGINYTTREVVLAAKNLLGMKGETFSSCFYLKPSISSPIDITNLQIPAARTYLLADAGVTKNPTEDRLKDIVLQTYESAIKLLDEEPRIAMLSFSTKGSAEDESIDKINRVIAKVKQVKPEIIIDGELQLDAAINPRIAAKKCPDSPLEGLANVLIVPDLNSGNILYKAFEQIGDYTAAGPILQGFNFPISDLSRGSTVEDVTLVIDCIKKLVN